MIFDDAPQHVWSNIAFCAYLFTLFAVSAVGMAFGYPQALWVWLLLTLTGWDSDDCQCEDCEPPKETASDIVGRRYANGELSEDELDEALDNVARIEQADNEKVEELV